MELAAGCSDGKPAVTGLGPHGAPVTTERSVRAPADFRALFNFPPSPLVDDGIPPRRNLASIPVCDLTQDAHALGVVPDHFILVHVFQSKVVIVLVAIDCNLATNLPVVNLMDFFA